MSKNLRDQTKKLENFKAYFQSNGRVSFFEIQLLVGAKPSYSYKKLHIQKMSKHRSGQTTKVGNVQ